MLNPIGGSGFVIAGSRNSLSRALRSADRCWLHRLDAVLRTRGITADQWTVLSCLSTSDGMTMSELARRTQLPASSATRSIDMLTTRGLVVRAVSASDRRQVIVGLSGAGRAVVGEAHDDELAVERQLREQLGDDRVDELVELLHQVSASVGLRPVSG